MPAQTRVFTIGSGCGHRRDPIGEFDLADRAQLDGARGAVHRQPFEVDSRSDVVPASRASGACTAGVKRSCASPRAADIGEELGQQISAGLGPVDQVMMRVDDRQVGLDDFLAPPVEPALPDWQVHARRGSRCRALHPLSPLSRVSMMVFDK
jgi:hypothetical protein